MNLEALLEAYPGADSFKFGDNEKLCQELIDLVRIGRKTATCGSLLAYQEGDWKLPEVGRLDIALNWDGTAALLIETTSVEMTRYCDVDESFALSEGENETLAGWQAGHRRFFERNGGFDPEMMLVCERFKLIKILDAGAGGQLSQVEA